MIKKCIYCGRFYTQKKDEKKCKECTIEYQIVTDKIFSFLKGFKRQEAQ